MKKLRSKLAILFILTLVISCLTVTSYADSDSIILDPTNNLDKIVLESKSYKELIENNPETKLLTRNEIYYKVEIDNNNEIKKPRILHRNMKKNC